MSALTYIAKQIGVPVQWAAGIKPLPPAPAKIRTPNGVEITIQRWALFEKFATEIHRGQPKVKLHHMVEVGPALFGIGEFEAGAPSNEPRATDGVLPQYRGKFTKRGLSSFDGWMRHLGHRAGLSSDELRALARKIADEFLGSLQRNRPGPVVNPPRETKKPAPAHKPQRTAPAEPAQPKQSKWRRLYRNTDAAPAAPQPPGRHGRRYANPPHIGRA